MCMTAPVVLRRVGTVQIGLKRLNDTGSLGCQGRFFFLSPIAALLPEITDFSGLLVELLTSQFPNPPQSQ